MSEKRPLDTVEEEKLDLFFKNGCGCKFGPNETGCYKVFAKEEIRKLRDDIFELASNERDMLVMGFILANKPINGEKSHFHFHGRRVCRTTFLFCFAISLKLYSTLCSHL